MCRPGRSGRITTGASRPAGLTLLVIMAAGGVSAYAQQGPDRIAPSPAPATAPSGVAATGPPDGAPHAGAPGLPALAPDIQVVRFQGPEGLSVEVLGPAPTPVSQGDGRGILSVGLKRGVGYRLRIGNIPSAPAPSYSR